MHQNFISWKPITSGQCSSDRGESPVQKRLGFDPWSPEEHRIPSISLKVASFVSDVDANAAPQGNLLNHLDQQARVAFLSVLTGLWNFLKI